MTRKAEDSKLIRKVTRRYARFLAAGMDGRAWYEQARARARMEYDHPDLWLLCFAATSPRTAVDTNIRNADRAYFRLRRGENPCPPSDRGRWGLASHAVERGLAHVAAGALPPGPKVGRFAEALLGDRETVVVDTLMLSAAGVFPAAKDGNGIRGTDRRRRICETAVRRLAARGNLTPREAQAAIWTGFRRTLRASRSDPILHWEPTFSFMRG